MVQYTTGFRFMANKQFKLEKRLGTSVCADISKYALKNQYVQFLYEKTTQHSFFGCQFCFFVGFWIKFGSRKQFFGLTWSETFFSIQYWNILQFTKTFFDNMCVLSYKKSRNGWKSIFHECNKKIIKHFAKKSFSVFKGAIFGIFEHTKTFFWQNVLLFFDRIHVKCFCNHF